MGKNDSFENYQVLLTAYEPPKVLTPANPKLHSRQAAVSFP